MSAKKLNVAASSCQILNLFAVSNYVVCLVCVHSPINPIQPLEKKQFKKSIIVSASNILQKMMVGHQA